MKVPVSMLWWKVMLTHLPTVFGVDASSLRWSLPKQHVAIDSKVLSKPRNVKYAKKLLSGDGC